VEVVKLCFDLFSRGDIEGMLDYIDPGIEISEPREIPGAESFQGHDGFIEAIEHWAGEFVEFRIDVERLIDAGDAVISHIRHEGRGRQSGVPVEIWFSYVFTLRNGQIVRWQIFATLDQALQAVGLPDG
jgi:ketosteroid isomerase-like protein